MSFRSLVGQVVAVGAALAGCAGPPPPPALPGDGRPMAAARLPGQLDARVEGLQTVRAGLEMIWEDPRFAEPERCRGSLSFAGPDSIRLRGVSAAFFTVFDLVAAGPNVWLDIPREDLAVFGLRADADWAELPLSPRSLMIALLAHPCPGEDCLGGARSHLDPGELRWTGDFGEFHADPTTGLPTLYVSPGTDPIRIHWLEWTDRSGTPWPARFRIERSGGRRLEVSYGRVQIGRTVPSSRFRAEPDASREILTPAEAAQRWADEADARSGVAPHDSP